MRFIESLEVYAKKSSVLDPRCVGYKAVLCPINQVIATIYQKLLEYDFTRDPFLDPRDYDPVQKCLESPGDAKDQSPAVHRATHNP